MQQIPENLEIDNEQTNGTNLRKNCDAQIILKFEHPIPRDLDVHVNLICIIDGKQNLIENGIFVNDKGKTIKAGSIEYVLTAKLQRPRTIILREKTTTLSKKMFLVTVKIGKREWNTNMFKIRTNQSQIEDRSTIRQKTKRNDINTRPTKKTHSENKKGNKTKEILSQQELTEKVLDLEKRLKLLEQKK